MPGLFEKLVQFFDGVEELHVILACLMIVFKGKIIMSEYIRRHLEKPLKEAFLNGNNKATTGVVVYAGEVCRYLRENIIAVPWNAIIS